jgi:hypothetical protein
MKRPALFLIAFAVVVFAFAEPTADQPKQPAMLHHPAMPVDTPRIKHFARVVVKKTTGTTKGVVLNEVNIFVINERPYLAEDLSQFKEATLTADEMVVWSPAHENAMGKYGSMASKGLIAFRNATIIPPMADLAKNKPLFLLDGMEQDPGSVKNLDPFTIKSITVSKDPHLVTRYGDKAKHGVVEITRNTLSIGSINEIRQEGTKEETIVPPPPDMQVIEEKAPGEPNKIYVQVEIEAEFKGGTAAWMRYLAANLDQKIPGKKGAPAGTYNVWVNFVVNKEGDLSDIKPLTNHGYGMEDEAARVIKNTATGNKWTAGKQNGRDVISYKKLKIAFVIE